MPPNTRRNTLSTRRMVQHKAIQVQKIGQTCQTLKEQYEDETLDYSFSKA